MAQNISQAYQFTKSIKGSALPIDTFLETLREKLNEQTISSFKSKEKTGELNTVGAGMTLGGNVGGGVAKSSIISHSWNPFEISCPSLKYFILGKFKGTVKISEMAKYSKKKKTVSYDLEDYDISGGIDFKPSGFITFVFLCLGIYLSIKLHVGFGYGILITVITAGLLYTIAKVLGNTEIDIPKSKLDIAIDNLQQYLNGNAKDLMK